MLPDAPVSALKLPRLEIEGRPTRMPERLPGEWIIASVSMGFGPLYVACENLKDMQRLYDIGRRSRKLVQVTWHKVRVTVVKQ